MTLKKKRVLVIAVLSLCIFSMLGVYVYAQDSPPLGTPITDGGVYDYGGTTNGLNSDEQQILRDYKESYLNNADILINAAPWRSAFRDVVWAFTRGILVPACEASEKLYDTCFGLINLTNNDKINAVLEDYKGALVGLIALSLAFLGIKLMFWNESKKPTIVTNIVILFLVVLGSNVLFSELNNLTILFKEGVMETQEKVEQKGAYSIVDSHLIDLAAVEHKLSDGFKEMDYKHRESKGQKFTGLAKVNDENIRFIELDEKLNYNSAQFDYKKSTQQMLKYRLRPASVPGEYVVSEVDNGWGYNSADDDDSLNNMYYRYYFEWIPAWVGLGALIAIYVALSYKCVRMIYEIIVGRVLAIFFSAELSGGERIRRILSYIFNAYVILCFTAVSISLYLLLDSIMTQNLNVWITVGVQLFLVFSVIDGPNLVAGVFGIDAGLSRSTSRLLAAYGMAKGVSKGLKNLGSKPFKNNKGELRSPWKKAGAALSSAYAGGSAGGMGSDIGKGLDDKAKDKAETSSKDKDGARANKGDSFGGNDKAKPTSSDSVSTTSSNFGDSTGDDEKSFNKESPFTHTERQGSSDNWQSFSDSEGRKHKGEIKTSLGDSFGGNDRAGSSFKERNVGAGSSTRTRENQKSEATRDNSFRESPKIRDVRSESIKPAPKMYGRNKEKFSFKEWQEKRKRGEDS